MQNYINLWNNELLSRAKYSKKTYFNRCKCNLFTTFATVKQ